MKEWQRQAEALFFIDRLGICEIAEIVHKSRETVSRYITACDGYADEMTARKKWSTENRKEYQRQWDRENRHRYNNIGGETMKREHEIAVMILSHEKF